MSPRIFALLLFVGIILQVTVTTVPLVISVLLVWYIFQRSESLFVIALVAGFIIDTLLIHPLGISSIALLIVMTTAYLYERKFEISTKEFVFLWSFVGSLGYLLVLDASYAVYQSAVNALFAIVLFQVNNVILNKVKNLGS